MSSANRSRSRSHVCAPPCSIPPHPSLTDCWRGTWVPRPLTRRDLITPRDQNPIRPARQKRKPGKCLADWVPITSSNVLFLIKTLTDQLTPRAWDSGALWILNSAIVRIVLSRARATRKVSNAWIHIILSVNHDVCLTCTGLEAFRLLNILLISPGRTYILAPSISLYYRTFNFTILRSQHTTDCFSFCSRIY